MTKPRSSNPTSKGLSVKAQVESALVWLKRHGTKSTRDGMARFAIPSDHAYGVSMKDIKALGRTIGYNHALAAALWETEVYEARMLASFVGDPEKLTPAEMDRWCKDFDNWAFCDALSFNLFDRSPHAWSKVAEWSKRRKEFRSEPPLRSCGVSPYMTSAPATISSFVDWHSSRRRPATTGISSRKP